MRVLVLEPKHVTLVVADAAPPFHVTPATIPIEGGETITIWQDADSCSHPSDVTIGGVAVPVVGYVTVTVASHAAGAVDVTAKVGDETLTSRAALQYVDPAAAPDESAFERVLVPLLYNGPGAYGSQWVTEGRLFPTRTDRPVRWMHDVVSAECFLGPCEGNDVDLTRFGNHPAGLLLFLPRDLGEIEATTVVRDASRDNANRDRRGRSNPRRNAARPVRLLRDAVQQHASRVPGDRFAADVFHARGTGTLQRSGRSPQCHAALLGIPLP